jgi:hypothetical protein
LELDFGEAPRLVRIHPVFTPAETLRERLRKSVGLLLL